MALFLFKPRDHYSCQLQQHKQMVHDEIGLILPSYKGAPQLHWEGLAATIPVQLSLEQG